MSLRFLLSPAPPSFFYTLKVSERDFFWQMHRALGMWPWGGAGRHEQAREEEVAGSYYNNTTRLPSDLQEVNKNDPLVRGPG